MDEADIKCERCGRSFSTVFGVVSNCPACGSSKLKQLPTIKEMSGLVKDFTGGKSMKQYMDEINEDF